MLRLRRIERPPRMLLHAARGCVKLLCVVPSSNSNSIRDLRHEIAIVVVIVLGERRNEEEEVQTKEVEKENHWSLQAEVMVETKPGGRSAWHSWASMGRVSSQGPVALRSGWVTLTPGGFCASTLNE